MKLYIDIRASKLVNGQYVTVQKGQGSNEQVNMAIFIDDRDNPRFRLFLNKRDDDSTDISVVDMGKPFPKNVVFKDTIKGNQQKGEICFRCEEPEHTNRNDCRYIKYQSIL